MYHAILIDPELRRLEVVQVRDWRCINRLIGSDTFNIAIPKDYETFMDDAVYVDDEGLLKPGLLSFHLRSYPQPLFGKGLIVGHDEEGESHAPKVPYMDYVSKHITWDPQYRTGEAA